MLLNCPCFCCWWKFGKAFAPTTTAHTLHGKNLNSIVHEFFSFCSIAVTCFTTTACRKELKKTFFLNIKEKTATKSEPNSMLLLFSLFVQRKLDILCYGYSYVGLWDNPKPICFHFKHFIDLFPKLFQEWWLWEISSYVVFSVKQKSISFLNH